MFTYQFSKRNLTHSEFLYGTTIKSKNRRVKELPTRIPEHIYHCPEQYGGEKCGFLITEQKLLEVVNLSNVLDDTYDYLEPNFHMECERHIPDTDEIEPAEAANAYLYLKANFDSNRV